MSAKICAREECGKTVYPIEELKCLDKVWHKQCFKCTICGMTLNMKNYKGYDKKPYCDPHYPKTVASVVTDTPEMRRLAENTKLQSQVKYHADYEKMKGTKIEIVDDPELARHLQNSRIQSKAQYHGDLEKKKIQDTNRTKEELCNEGTQSSDASIYHQDINSNNNNFENSFSTNNSNTIQKNVLINNKNSFYSQRLADQTETMVYSTDLGGRVLLQKREVGSIADYDPINTWETKDQNTSDKYNRLNFSNEESIKKSNFVSSPNSTMLKNNGFTVKALYDYTAADTDEVSFKEHDIIVNCKKVDEGWMTGTVQRTLVSGMLPANYVKQINLSNNLYKFH